MTALDRDPHRKLVEGRRRVLTIHNGTRLTPTVVRLLEVLVDEANELLDAGFEEEQTGRAARLKSSGAARERVDPVLVARSDGLAVYVRDDGLLA